MARTKKNGPADKPKRPTEEVRDELAGYIVGINEELQRIKVKNANSEAEVDAIGDLLDKIDTCFSELEDRTDKAEAENDEHLENQTAFEERISELEAIAETVHEMDTMIGTLKYQTNNLVDAELMDLFTECLVEIQPAVMLENLKTIKAFKTVM